MVSRMPHSNGSASLDRKAVLDLCKKARIRNIAVATFERADTD